MKFGYVKVCAASPEIKVADVDFNKRNIISAIQESAKSGSQLTVFPELGICGYTCGDLFNQRALISACENAVKDICLATKGLSTLVFIGVPVAVGGKLYNCAVAIHDGTILGIVPKTFLPNYGEFYELRNFCGAGGDCVEIRYAGVDTIFGRNLIFAAENCPDFTVAAEICEDLWTPLSPSVKHSQAGANIIVNLSCSNETAGKSEYRRELVKVQSGKLICGYIYCDAGDGESTTDMAFSGHNIISENGRILYESKLFENGLLYGEIDVELLAAERNKTAGVYYTGTEKVDDDYVIITFTTDNSGDSSLRKYDTTPFVPSNGLSERAELVLTIQQKGLEKRLMHTGAKTAVIGISGGLDSALALLVTVRAFKSLKKDLKNIIAVTMPCFGTTDRTKNNSLDLMRSLGVIAKTIPVDKGVISHFKDISHNIDNKNVTFENAQARIRTLVLMDLANDNDGLVIGTGDLSELALGWATYNGDHMSMYGVNSSVPKTLVKHLISYEAEKYGGEIEKILKSILNTEISPELLPPDKDGGIAQKTEDIVGPYILHDFFLYYVVRYGFAPDKVLYIAEKAFKGDFDKAVIKKWLKNFYKRFFSQQFKRSCMPDGVKVGSVALSPRGDWRMPSDAVVKLWMDLID